MYIGTDMAWSVILRNLMRTNQAFFELPINYVYIY